MPLSLRAGTTAAYVRILVICVAVKRIVLLLRVFVALTKLAQVKPWQS